MGVARFLLSFLKKVVEASVGLWKSGLVSNNQPKHKMKTQVVNVNLRGERVAAGLTEDGDPYFVSVIQVVAETKAGRRFLHDFLFESHQEAAALRLEARVKAAGVIDTTHWNETYPVYGSDAYLIEDADRNFRLQVALREGNREDIERYS